MLGKELRAIGRAALVLAVVGWAGCSFKDKGINTTIVEELDADGLGGSGAGGAGGGGVVFDGSASGKDLGGPTTDAPSAQPDGLVEGDAAVPATDAPGLTQGSTCTTDAVCGSGFCADGVCCDRRCGEPCHSCGGGNGVVAGACAPDPADTVCGAVSCMGSTLTPAPRCAAGGACMSPTGAACPGSLTCASGTACKSKCAADVDCTGGLVCDLAAGTCRPPGKPIGQACMTGAECMTGQCADGVCCDMACTGLCRACVTSQTGKPDGTCANVTAGVKDTRCDRQEPSTCGRDGTCDGAGQCRRYPNGMRCGTSCCRDSSGPGSTPAVCAFQCNNGACDRNNPTVLDRCEGVQCCCPTAQGGPACTGALGCSLGMCVN